MVGGGVCVWAGGLDIMCEREREMVRACVRACVCILCSRAGMEKRENRIAVYIVYFVPCCMQNRNAQSVLDFHDTPWPGQVLKCARIVSGRERGNMCARLRACSPYI